MKVLKVLAILFALLFVTYGFFKYQALHTRIDAEERQANGFTRASSKELPAENWKDKHIKLFGSIDKEKVYEVLVTYVADLDKFSCEQGFLFGPYRKTKSFSYQPSIIDGKHKVRVPLDEVDPNKGCQYKLYKVSINFPHDKRNSGSRHEFTLFSQNTNESYSGFKQKNLSHKTIDVECILPNSDGSDSYSPCGLKPLKSEFTVTQQLPLSSVTYEVNISHISVQDYYQDIFVNSEFYNSRLNYLKRRQQMNDFIPVNSRNLSELRDELKRINIRLQDVFNNQSAALDKYLLNEYPITPYQKSTARILKDSKLRLRAIDSLQDQMFYGHEQNQLASAWSIDGLDKIFSSSDYYKSQIAFLLRGYGNGKPNRYSLANIERDLNNRHRDLKKGLEFHLRQSENCSRSCGVSIAHLTKPFKAQWETILNKDLSVIRRIEADLLLTGQAPSEP